MGVDVPMQDDLNRIDQRIQEEFAMETDDDAFGAHSPMSAPHNVSAANVSMENCPEVGTPKKLHEVGPIFDETEFGPMSAA